MSQLPCIDCITYSICKSKADSLREQYLFDKIVRHIVLSYLYDKCSLINLYLPLELQGTTIIGVSPESKLDDKTLSEVKDRFINLLNLYDLYTRDIPNLKY